MSTAIALALTLWATACVVVVALCRSAARAECEWHARRRTLERRLEIARERIGRGSVP